MGIYIEPPNCLNWQLKFLADQRRVYTRNSDLPTHKQNLIVSYFSDLFQVWKFTGADTQQELCLVNEKNDYLHSSLPFKHSAEVVYSCL